MPIKQNILATVDTALFGYHPETGLSLLLIQRKNPPFQGNWALPGGFIDDGEDPFDAALRELEEETGVKVPAAWQYGAYGNPKRDPRGQTLSVAYYTLVNTTEFQPQAADDAADARWWPVNEIPETAFDHELLISDALDHLRQRFHRFPMGQNLLPANFSPKALIDLYETITQRNIDHTNIIQFLNRKGVIQIDDSGQCSFDRERYEAFSSTGFWLDF